MYWKHDLKKEKKYCILFNFDRIIFIKIHIHKRIIGLLSLFCVVVFIHCVDVELMGLFDFIATTVNTYCFSNRILQRADE